MIVLAESNFVIELALEQEEAAHAQRIVELAETHQIALVIPACAFAEPGGPSAKRTQGARFAAANRPSSAGSFEVLD